jgi:nicotinate-nucleotide adenylyltransferase
VNPAERPEYLLFGGSFDPIHYGHLFIAEAARALRKAERVLFLPTRAPRHRAALSAPALDRTAMIRVAIASNPHFALDLCDLAADASGYSIDLLPRLFAAYPEARLSLLLGEDSLTQSPWHRFNEVVSMVDRCSIAPRHEEGEGRARFDGFLATLEPAVRAKIELLEQPRITISSSAIRETAAQAGSIRYLVPESVRHYILEHGLYRAFPASDAP